MIEIIAGTNRPGANALKIARSLEAMYKAKGIKAQVFDLAQLPRELFDPSSYGEKPASFKPFQDRILAADGLHVVVPEYNGGFPGVLKYFIDMLQFPESFERRPVAYVGEAAGMWGAIRPVEMLQLVFGYRNAYVYPERVFISGVGGKLDDNGNITDDKIRGMLEKQAAGFAAFAAQHKDEAGKG